MVFNCEDQHVICLSCFEIFVKSRLSERQFLVDDKLGYTLNCPVGCDDSLITEPKHFLAILSDREDYDRYQRFAAEEFLLKSGGCYCPYPNCSTPILPDNVEERKIKCPQCNFVFCKQCSNGFHIGECVQDVVMHSVSKSWVRVSLSRVRVIYVRFWVFRVLKIVLKMAFLV